MNSELYVRHIGALWDGTEILHDVAVHIRGGRVRWVGPDAELRGARGDGGSGVEIDATGLIGTPGLVDCHTHSTWAGSRLDDFRRRLAGETYTQILEAGGGIHSTVRATAAASLEELTRLTRERLGLRLRHGVTLVEIKSGYGLNPEAELRMLKAARAAAGPVEVTTTFLGAHAVPPGRDRRDYVDEVVGEQLERCLPYADAIDVYCDAGAFTLAEAERVLLAGRARGLGLHVHAEQVSWTGAAELAGRLGALTADHLERVDDVGARAMGDAGVIAVLLPAAMLYLRDRPPPVGLLRSAGVRMAVATDHNPGSSPAHDLIASATLACVTMGLTVEEALAGITSVAADALGRPDHGRVKPGSVGDLALFSPPVGERPDPGALIQHLGGPPARWVIKAGNVVWEGPPPAACR